MRLSLIPITHVRFFFQLYEIDDNPARREFLDELFAFMQKRGESEIRIIVTALPLSLSLSLSFSRNKNLCGCLALAGPGLKYPKHGFSPNQFRN